MNGDEMIYTYVSEENARIFSQMELQEKAVYKIVQAAGDLGCTITELKTQFLQQNPDIPP